MVFPPRPEGPPPAVADPDEQQFSFNYGKINEKMRPPGPPPDEEEDDELTKIKKDLFAKERQVAYPKDARIEKDPTDQSFPSSYENVNIPTVKDESNSPQKQKDETLAESSEITLHQVHENTKITAKNAMEEDLSGVTSGKQEGKGGSIVNHENNDNSSPNVKVDPSVFPHNENTPEHFRGGRDGNSENPSMSRPKKLGRATNYSKGRRPPPGLPPPEKNSEAEVFIFKNDKLPTSSTDAQEHHDKLKIEVDKSEGVRTTSQVDSEDQRQKCDDEAINQGATSNIITSDDGKQKQPFHAWGKSPSEAPLPSNDADAKIDQVLHENIRPGRISIRCIKAENIRRKDQTTGKARITPYLCFELGESDHLVQRKTKSSKQSGDNPLFENELITFDIENPSDYFINSDVKLRVKLYDKSAWSEYLLGETIMSATRLFFLREKSDEWLPLVEDGDVSSNSRVNLEFGFDVVKTGMFVVKIIECTNIQEQFKDKRAMHSFVKLCIGNGIGKRSQTAEDGGNNPYFGEEEVLLWVDEANCFDNLKVGLHRQDESGDSLIGGGDVHLLAYMSESKAHATEREEIVPLSISPEINAGNTAVGEMKMKIHFLEAGTLKAKILCAKYLRKVGMTGQMDPYVLIKADGNGSSLTETTKPDKDGGTDPTWNEELTLMVVDHHRVEIECYDHDILTNAHEKIGSAYFSLLPVYRTGYVDVWLQLKHENEFGVSVDAGQVNITFDFVGPRGVAFPRHQPSMASFDDTHHVHKRGKPGNTEENITNQTDQTKTGPLAQDIIEEGPSEVKDRDNCEFSDEDIRSSFGILDLDKNGYLGASEIRHILMCMGELVTDEEIDMMISMLDTNGDGQVSYEEFRIMIMDPDPSRDDFGEDIIKKNKNSLPVENATIIEQKKELEKRDIKRRVLSHFIATNRIRKEDITRIWEIYRQKDDYKNTRQSAEDMSPFLIEYATFCDLLTVVEPTGETKQVFSLFDSDGSGKVDIRELVLSFSNFVAALSIEERCRFMFDMFDVDRSGFLSLSEVECMLMGNHMQSRNAISKKAQTVMKCADTDNSGGITHQELLVAAAKFPNLLLPAHPIE